MNEMTPVQTGGALAPAGAYDPYAAYGRAAGADSRPYLKCSKGDWLLGQEATEIPTKTRFLANMSELSIGWIKWEDGKPVERLMGLLTEGFQPAKRSELGDDDKSQWPVDNNGVPQDPWQFSNNLPLKPAGDAINGGEEVVFTTSSKGGIGAIGKLCVQYGKEYRQRPGQVPVIEIDTGSYMHPKKEFGRIKFPILTIVDWVAEPGADEDPDSPAEHGSPAAPEAKPAAEAKKKSSAKF